jgi:hypothetical protein
MAKQTKISKIAKKTAKKAAKKAAKKSNIKVDRVGYPTKFLIFLVEALI